MNATRTPIVLMSHPKPVGERPPIEDVLVFVYIERSHHFLNIHKGRRWLSNATFQAVVRNEPGSAWCAARLLLEGERVLSLRATPTRPLVSNTCGFAECVNVNHWTARDATRPSPYIIMSFEAGWQLCSGNDVVMVDRVMPARVGTDHVVHVLRTWRDNDHTEFRTACQLSPDPGMLVVEGPDVLPTCEACIR